MQNIQFVNTPATKVTMWEVIDPRALALVWQPTTVDIPATLINMPSSVVPATAVGAIIGVETGYSVAPAGGAKGCVQANIQSVTGNGNPSYPYTDIIRVEQFFDPAAAVGAAMGQAWVAFPSSAQQIRYRVVSVDPTVANKHIIIQLHGYWEQV